MENFKSRVASRYVEAAVGVAALAVGGVLIFYFSNFSGVRSSRQDVWGQFGDFVGGTLNPLFGFISILVLVATLNLQRKELAESRKTADDNNKILGEQLRSMHLQSLENTFFKMIDEFKNDSVVSACRGKGVTEGVILAVYSYTCGRRDYWSRSDRALKSEYFKTLTKGEVNFGQVKHVLVEKVVNLVEIANSLDNNQIHYGLMQTVIGPRLLSSLIQFAYHEDQELYAILVKAKRVLKGINNTLIYIDEVARDFWDDEKYQKFIDEHDSNLEDKARALASRERSSGLNLDLDMYQKV